jgi:hypothetical protein
MQKKILKTYEQIEIIGSLQYVKQIVKALELLKKKASQKFSTVKKYIGRIEDFPRSEMAPWENPPTFYFSKKSAFYSITWCASDIVHDAHHSKLYLDYWKKYKKQPPYSVYGGKKIELECFKHQILVSKQIGAPVSEIIHLERQKGTHYRLKRTW